MKKLIKVLVLVCSILIFFGYTVNAKTQFPNKTEFKYINDYVNMVDLETKRYVVSVGKELENKTGAQVVVVIIDSLQGQSIEEYANELFRKWGIGQKDKDNGVLILVSKQDKKRRVEVGRQLEGALPDLYTHNIMEEIFKPEFKKQNYDIGIKNTYSAIADVVAKEYNVKLEKNINVKLPSKHHKESRSGKFVIAIAIILFIMDSVLNRGRIIKELLELFFWNNRGGPGGFGGFGGFGGGNFYDGDSQDSNDLGDFGGGSSDGGGSSGDW